MSLIPFNSDNSSAIQPPDLLILHDTFLLLGAQSPAFSKSATECYATLC